MDTFGALYTYKLELSVRDYECDMQGIVNNAQYQHYLEHARHEFLRERGLSFAQLTREGILLVVVRAELDYLYPLRSGDLFAVCVRCERESRLRARFIQDIYRMPDGKPILRGKIIATAINAEGRPLVVEHIWKQLGV